MADEPSQILQVRLSATQLANLARFQEERGIASQETAVALLLDIAFEAVSGTGRRYWDKPLSVSGEAPIGQARVLAERLRRQGHTAAAERLHAATAGERITRALLEALREACQTVLTTVEALDPATQLMAEELRLEVDKRLSS